MTGLSTSEFLSQAMDAISLMVKVLIRIWIRYGLIESIPAERFSVGFNRYIPVNLQFKLYGENLWLD